MLLWKWTNDKSEASQKQIEFANFKQQKRLKLGDKPNEYLQTEADTSLMTDFERSVTKGRFLLEKKQKFNLQAQSRVVSCDQVRQGDLKLICIG